MSYRLARRWGCVICVSPSFHVFTLFGLDSGFFGALIFYFLFSPLIPLPLSVLVRRIDFLRVSVGCHLKGTRAKAFLLLSSYSFFFPP